jgi:DNA-binding Lrp family transcriptional regulator
MARDVLDLFDRRLLDLVQRDADVPAEKLAEQVGLSPSAVQRRLKKLRKSGVIASTVCVLDPAKVGNPTLFVVGLELERERPELLTRLAAWIEREDRVQQGYYLTGTWDLLLMIVVPSVSAFDSFMAALLEENPNVRRFSTSVVLSTRKRQLFVPVKEN